MSEAHTDLDERGDPLRRSSNKALAEIGVFAILSVVFVFGFSFAASEGRLDRLFEVGVTAGDVVLGHIGWALGGYIPLLLSFYLLVAGQDWKKLQSASQTRRTLGLTAEIIAGALAPAVLLVLVAVIRNPAQAAALIVIIPSFGVVLFLASQLGSFIIFANSERLASAYLERDRLQGRREQLGVGATRLSSAEFVGNVVLASAIGMVAVMTVGASAGSLLPISLFLLLIASVMSGVNLYGVHERFTGRTGLDRSAGVFATVGLNVVLVVLAGQLLLDGHPATGSGLLAVLAFLTFSSLLPRSDRSGSRRNWTLRASGIAMARSYHERRLRLITADIARLEADKRINSSRRGVLVSVTTAVAAGTRAFSESRHGSATQRR